MVSARFFFRDVLVYWKVFITILTPILLSPLIFVVNRPETDCAYVVIIMAIYWIFEVFPLAITALLPMILYPMLGVVSGSELARFYVQDTTMVFLAGLMVALVMENVNLHKRIGTGILLKVGTTPSRIMIGIMFPTWFLSMFISNTAATSMMVAAAKAVVKQLTDGMKKAKLRRNNPSAKGVTNEAYEMECQDGGGDVETLNSIFKDSGVVIDVVNINNDDDSDINNNNSNSDTIYSYDDDGDDDVTKGGIEGKGEEEGKDGEKEKKEEKKEEEEDEESLATTQLDEADQRRATDLSQMLSLAIAYSANIGGTGTLTGTPTNLLVADAANRAFKAHNNTDSPITYASWMFFGLPTSVLCMVFLWCWLQLYYLKGGCCRTDKAFKEGEASIKTVMREEYNKLGSVSFGEVVTGLLLLLLVLLWLTRDPGFIDGYASFFAKRYVTDSTPAIFVILLLFVTPLQKPDWLCLRKDKTVRAKNRRALLTWHEVSTRLPWGTVFLLGGGFAMAEGCRRSGLTDLIGSQLSSLSYLPTWTIALIITIIISFITEVMSNTAVMALFLPVFEAMSNDLSINPLYLMLPAGLAASFAFMLPIATPPNAIVFACESLTVIQMMKVGFIMNLLCVVVVTLAINTWGLAIFNLNNLPWATAAAANATTIITANATTIITTAATSIITTAITTIT